MRDKIIHGKPLGPRVSSVSPMEDYKLLLTFNNGERRIFDVKPLLLKKVFKPLQHRLFFESVKVSHGSILWPHDIDYCPDSLYAESTPVT